MAQSKHKTHTQREKFVVNGAAPPEIKRPEAEPTLDPAASTAGARWGMAVWAAAFGFMVLLMIWDLITGLFWR